MPTLSIEYEGSVQRVDVPEGTEIAIALEQIDINPVTVLIKQDDTVLPHRTPVKEDTTIQLIDVISGG